MLQVTLVLKVSVYHLREITTLPNLKHEIIMLIPKMSTFPVRPRTMIFHPGRHRNSSADGGNGEPSRLVTDCDRDRRRRQQTNSLPVSGSRQVGRRREQVMLACAAALARSLSLSLSLSLPATSGHYRGANASTPPDGITNVLCLESFICEASLRFG